MPTRSWDVGEAARRSLHRMGTGEHRLIHLRGELSAISLGLGSLGSVIRVYTAIASTQGADPLMAAVPAISGSINCALFSQIVHYEWARLSGPAPEHNRAGPVVAGR